MQELNIKQEFECTLEVLLRARHDRYQHLDKFPELKNVTIVSEERDGHMLKQVRDISIADSMPAIFKTLLPAGADALHETSEFDETQNLHTFVVTPGGGLDHIFHIQGLSRYFEEDGRAVRTYNLKISSKAGFLVSGVVESTIAEIYRSSVEKDRKSIQDFISLYGKEANTQEQTPGTQAQESGTQAGSTE